MLYAMHDLRQRVLAPVFANARLASSLISHPANPLSYTPQVRMMNAGLEVMQSLWEERKKPEWGIEQISMDGKTYPVIQEVVEDKEFCQLLKFHIPSRRKPRKILVLAPLSGHFSTLLRDTVKRLLQDSEVYITDWKDAKHVPLDAGRFGLEDYLGYIIDFLTRIEPINDKIGGGVHAMAVCQPAPLLLAAVAILNARKSVVTPRSMILMGGPVDTKASPTLVTQLAENRPLSWFKQHNIHTVPRHFAGEGRAVYPGFMQLRAFWSMNPARHNMAHWNMFQHLVRGDGDNADKTRDFYDEYMAVLDVTEEFFIETIDHIFQRRTLISGNMDYQGEKLDCKAITHTALLTIEGELDDISAPGQTLAAHAMCPNIPAHHKHHLLVDKVGHYGIFNGRRWRTQIAPKIIDFMDVIDKDFNQKV